MHNIEAKTILSAKNGMNIYRGCTHGCIYCDSRSDCYGMDHDFEDIAVKINAPDLLEDALRRKRKPCMIGTGSMCDPYMHCEEKLGMTRKCLEIIDKYDCGVTIITKSDRILRDIDLLERINRKTKAVVQMTLTTFDEELCKILEPNVCTTKRRFEVLMECKKLGIPTVVWLCPILPFINDTEENLRGILDYCFEAEVKGIINFGIGLTLRNGNREYFYKKLDEHFPGIKRQYQKKYGYSYGCQSDNSPKLMSILGRECRKRGVMCRPDEIFAYLNEYPEKNEQLSLF
ncbi:MAG: radical SAM protein [Clostridia bacterium]|nr:radical SAM protein [Clostridia bacterium]